MLSKSFIHKSTHLLLSSRKKGFCAVQHTTPRSCPTLVRFFSLSAVKTLCEHLYKSDMNSFPHQSSSLPTIQWKCLGPFLCQKNERLHVSSNCSTPLCFFQLPSANVQWNAYPESSAVLCLPFKQSLLLRRASCYGEIHVLLLVFWNLHLKVIPVSTKSCPSVALQFGNGATLLQMEFIFGIFLSSQMSSYWMFSIPAPCHDI